LGCGLNIRQEKMENITHIEKGNIKHTHLKKLAGIVYEAFETNYNKKQQIPSLPPEGIEGAL
jgi:hypothetical protein